MLPMHPGVCPCCCMRGYVTLPRRTFTGSVRGPLASHRPHLHLASKCRPRRTLPHAARAGSKSHPAPPEQTPDNGVEERKQSNAEAGSSDRSSPHAHHGGSERRPAQRKAMHCVTQRVSMQMWLNKLQCLQCRRLSSLLGHFFFHRK